MTPAYSYVRLSSFYFFYFSLLGVLVPYWSLYLQSFGFNAQTIGTLMSILMASRIIAPNVWGWLADRSGKRVAIVRFGSLVTCLIFIFIFWQESAWGIALVMAGFSFFWNAVLPQFEVLTLSHLGERTERYSRIRLWGSIGFIVTVVGVGALLDWVDISWLPHLMLLLMVMIWLSSLCVNGDTALQDRSQNGFMRQLWRPQVLAFFVVCFLVQFSHGPYYTFYSVLMDSLGYSRVHIGLLWAIGVAAEVIVFIYMHALIGRFGLRSIMLASLVLCVLRWALIGIVPESLPLMLFAQVLHAATFGTLHATGIALVHNYFSPACHGQGQAMFSSVGFGVGGASGALVSGYMWDGLGAPATFLMAALAAIAAVMIATVWIKPENCAVAHR